RCFGSSVSLLYFRLAPPFRTPHRPCWTGSTNIWAMPKERQSDFARCCRKSLLSMKVKRAKMLVKLVPVIATLLLCACVLSSKTPKFAAADGAAAIAANTEFDAYTKDGNGWRKEDESFSFKRDGKAYLMSDGKNIASVSFIQLTPEWFAAQYRENDEPFFYGLVRTTGGGLDITPLPCDKLKAFAAGTKD